MASYHFVVSLGIIVLITSCFVHSGKIPPKTDSAKDKDNSVRLENDRNEHEQEDQQKPGGRDNEREEDKGAETRADHKGRQEQEKAMNDNQDNADVHHVASEDGKKGNSPKLRFVGGKQRLDDDQSQCTEDIARLCPEIPKGNNFALLVCLQDKAKEDDLTTECHHMLWEYKRTFSKDEKFERSVAEKFCVADLKQLPECNKQGKIIACLLEHRENLTTASCKHMMTKMQAIFFSNYLLIENFLEDCSADVERLTCGRLQTERDEEDIHSQNEVIECLEDNQGALAEKCQKQIFRLGELSSDDYHLDRPLFYACKDDREMFCEDVQSGDGKVYKCLKKHKTDGRMSDECRKKLTERQKLEAKDPKANYPLMKNCFKYYQQYKDQFNCERGKTKHGALANILVCLEKAMDEGEKVGGKCQAELYDLRQQMMEDYAINPKLVAQCDVEIEKHCGGGKGNGGETIDCLMGLAEENEGKTDVIREGCFKAVSIRETTKGYVLSEAQLPYLALSMLQVLSCLMENLHTESITPECEEQLLHLEFFIARDFSVLQREEEGMQDPEVDYKLERSCRKMIVLFCSDVKPSQIFSCLKKNKNDQQMERSCKDIIIKRQIRQSEDIRLNPQILNFCALDLPKFCPEPHKGEGKIIACLKKHVDNLSDECREYTEQLMRAAAHDYRMDARLVAECGDEVGSFRESLYSLLRYILRAPSVAVVDEMENMYVVFAVVKCLLDAFKSNSDSFDRECHFQLASRRAMWGQAVKVLPGESLGDLAAFVVASPSKNYFFIVFATGLALIFVGGLVFGRLSKRIKREVKDR
ncbi:PREDICTED: Golgi apparatus protein 1-like [Acropora digitifera]|uniref:Golgi apparatus protein 1-like n=1 Tax=Acropora digitifera TaxID=70779 RepID=UPI00077A5DFB|nr:PREDICTED: Golgi apparatus protein 1-like [Acropora digitifera]